MKPIKEITLRRKGYKPSDECVQKVYNVTNFPYGFTTAVELDENCEGVARYMTKYITKDLQKIFDMNFIIPEYAQFSTAIGAALA